MQNLEQFVCYDHLLVEPLAALNWQVEEIPWRRKSVDWDRFDAVIIRSPWDYQDDPERFMHVLQTIDNADTHLENSLDIVRWNLDKRYLQDMQSAGIPIVPTQWQKQFQSEHLSTLFDRLGSNELIIKPVVSANADHTYRLSKEKLADHQPMLQEVFKQRPLMIQPFMENIITEGEYSLFYFAGSYSHAILKTPAGGDFRVQEEHGGRLQSIEPEPNLSKAGRQTMQALPETPLYARVDFVRSPDNNFALMELELIEPSLYFNMNAESPERFARCFNHWMQQVRD